MRGKKIAFIGSAGLPNRYGGFEAFLEHCAPEMVDLGFQVVVTCDARLYEEKSPYYNGVERVFLKTPANGALSVFHDLFAFFSVLKCSDCVFVLGVSGGLWFPLFRFFAGLFSKKIFVNIDGVEWQRGKYGAGRKIFLWMSDRVAQLFAHGVIYDNQALARYVVESCRHKARMIPYSGDHVLRRDDLSMKHGSALTVCRIEPENNIEMMIEGVLKAGWEEYKIVGNWNASEYGRCLREKYKSRQGIDLLDPVYDPVVLAGLRERCAVYIHGHSVGGTNPSLVEMLFYDARILCFDVPFHHATAGSHVEYFKSADDLARLLVMPYGGVRGREVLRASYTKNSISIQYLDLAAM